MVLREIHVHVVLRVAREDLRDLAQGLARDDDLHRIVGFAQGDLADGDAVTVQGNDLPPVSFDLKELAGHHFVGVVGRNGKDRLLDRFAQGELRYRNRMLFFHNGDGGEFVRVPAGDPEDRLLTADHSLAGRIRLDRDISFGKLAHDIGEQLCLQGSLTDLQDNAFHDRFNTEFHIVSRKPDLTAFSPDEDALQNRHGGLGRYSFDYNTDLLQQFTF